MSNVQVARQNGEEITEDDEDEWYARRMDAGLSALQNADYVLAWVVMEDDGVSLGRRPGIRQSGPHRGWKRQRLAYCSWVTASLLCAGQVPSLGSTAAMLAPVSPRHHDAERLVC